MTFFWKDSKALAAKEKEVKKITDGLHGLQEASNKDAEALAAAQQHFNAVSAGLSSNEDGAEATLAGQMIACKNDISKAQTEAKQVSADAKHGVVAAAVCKPLISTISSLSYIGNVDCQELWCNRSLLSLEQCLGLHVYICFLCCEICTWKHLLFIN